MNLHTYHFIHYMSRHVCADALHIRTLFTTHRYTHTPLHMYNSNHRSTAMLHIIFPDLHPQCVKTLKMLVRSLGVTQLSMQP
uniref:Uncharacterized protein n=1 Tax=Arundo donax TaxID=35708 RepID=A0A0A9GX29_ARUDO